MELYREVIIPYCRVALLAAEGFYNEWDDKMMNAGSHYDWLIWWIAVACKAEQAHCLDCNLIIMISGCLDLLVCMLSSVSGSQHWRSSAISFLIQNIMNDIISEGVLSDFTSLWNSGWVWSGGLSGLAPSYSKTKFKAAGSVHWHFSDPDGWTQLMIKINYGSCQKSGSSEVLQGHEVHEWCFPQ